MKIYYLGRFPPPFGGVTIKNEIIFNSLSKSFKIIKIDLGLIRKMNFREIVKLFKAIINPSNSFIVGSASTSRRVFTSILYYFNRKALRNSILIVMGGAWSSRIANDTKHIQMVNNYKKIYVETKGMLNKLFEAGVTNGSVFSNYRNKPEVELTIKTYGNELKCLFFSQITKEKGADIVIEAIEQLAGRKERISLDFYGKIKEDYRNEFLSRVSQVKQIRYLGEFIPKVETTYQKLNQYDLLLFPTRWKIEGVPGILIESKIAGLPAIVSNTSFNSEIIENNVSGLVLKDNSAEELSNAIKILIDDIPLLENMKINARESGQGYFIENNIDVISALLHQITIGGKK